MQFTCENCQRRYTIPDDKVRGRSVKVRCKSCQHLTTVPALVEPAEAQNPFADGEGERTSVANVAQLEQLRKDSRASPPPAARKAPVRMDVSAQWFAMLKGAQQGPYDVGMVAAKFQSGELHGRSFLWKQGMAEWKRADEIEELSALWTPPQPAQKSAPPPPRIAAPVQPEPVREPDPEPVPEPEPERPEPSPRPALDTLFSDEDLPPPDEPAAKKDQQQEHEDPFAALGGTLDPSAGPPPGEATRFFMQQAGVNKGQRNPPWKIALFIVLFLGVPIGGLYLLSELHVVPLQISSVNDKGEEVKTSVFSSEGVQGLGDLLLGKKKKPVEAASPVEPPVSPKKKDPAVVAKKDNPLPQKDPNAPTQEELAALYGDSQVGSNAPKLKIAAEKPSLEKGSGGLDEEQVVKVVGQSQAAFQNCIELELKKNPNLKVGKVVISATVAPSGKVLKADIDKRDVAMSNLGECLKSRAQRMVFAAFEGDETDVQIPLMVTSSF